MTQELSEMDKKNFSCLTSPTSKSLTQQEPASRSSRQDGPAAGQVARKPPQTRRRESPLGGVSGPSARVDSAAKKTQPPKNKGSDKRPKPRLNTNARQNQTEENESELGYLPTTAGRKQNVNHLLNFHFAPREGRNLWRSFNTHPGSSPPVRSNSKQSAGPRPKFNKENFLQANCQFLVKGGEDYSVYDCDPDILVNWNLIEQIKICITGENPSCPICLDSPVGAKMTRCGHIFCWPCILHYLALTDKDARVCPICYDSEPISAIDLKSVIVKLYPDVESGDEISMQLMVRAKDTMHAYPLSTKPGVPPSLDNSYSKLVSATPIEVLEYVLERERSELIIRLKEDEKCPEVCFIQQALNHLSARRNAILSELAALDPMQSHLALLKKPFVPTLPKAGATAGRTRTVSGESASSLGQDFATKSVEIDGFSYFYQAENGQNIFLHPLNMAMLWRNYGPDPATWPQVIRVKIIEKESKTMCVDERMRYRFLRHLPVTTCFHVIEADSTKLQISDEILHEFEERLALREKRRADKLRDEKRREEVLEAEERKKNAPKPTPKIESKIDFPTWADEEYEGLQHALLTSLAESQFENGEDDNAKENSSPEVEESVSTSQRAPLRDREWRSLDTNYPGLSSEGASSMSTSSSHMSFARVAANPCTGKTKLSLPTFKSVVQTSPAKTDGDAESEEYSAPNYRASVSDAIAKAFATHNDGKETSGENSSNGQKKKGRRGKGKVLFATGGVGSFGSN